MATFFPSPLPGSCGTRRSKTPGYGLDGRSSPFRVFDLPVSSRVADKPARQGHSISGGGRVGLEDDKTADLHPAPVSNQSTSARREPASSTLLTPLRAQYHKFTTASALTSSGGLAQPSHTPCMQTDVKPRPFAATQQLGPKAKMVTCTGAFSRSIVVGFGRDFRQNLNRCEQGHPQSSGGAQ